MTSAWARGRLAASSRSTSRSRWPTRVLFGKLKKGGTVRVTVETKESGVVGLKLKSLADELPVRQREEQPKPDAVPRKPSVKRATAQKPAGAKGQGSAGRQGRRQARGLVPQLPRKG